MRTIKFRAWDKRKKVMMPVELMDWTEWWVSCNPIGVYEPLAFGERNSFKNEETDRHILMQYTGLKDKNGMGIYEGDICKDSLGWVFAVVWDDSNARFLGRNSKPIGETYICYVGREPAVEIIGNIYDNPELLEGRT